MGKDLNCLNCLNCLNFQPFSHWTTNQLQSPMKLLNSWQWIQFACLGKPRQGLFKNKKHTNAIFNTNTVPFISNKLAITDGSLDGQKKNKKKKLYFTNSPAFWKKVNLMNNCKQSVPCTEVVNDSRSHWWNAKCWVLATSIPWTV